MLIREDPATELTVATRILARAGALPDAGRVTLRVGEVAYVVGGGVSNHTVTPYDVAIVRIADGDLLAGVWPPDIERYLERYRAGPLIASVIATGAGLIGDTSLRACAVRVLEMSDPAPAGSAPATRDAIEAAWLRLVTEARVSGALIGAFPAGTEP